MFKKLAWGPLAALALLTSCSSFDGADEATLGGGESATTDTVQSALTGVTVTMCAPGSVPVGYNGTGGGYYYTCTPCTGPYPSSCSASIGNNDYKLTVLVQSSELGTSSATSGWPADLIWNYGGAGNTKFVVFHPGGDGENYDGYDYLVNQVKSRSPAGSAIRVSWYDGPKSFGWMTRPSGSSTDLWALSKRPAAVFEWINTNMANASGKKLAVAGCSRGSDAVFAARLWHGGDSYINYMLLGGGPPSTDVYKSCSLSQVYGRCVEQVLSCSTGSQCSSGICDSWNYKTEGSGDISESHMRSKIDHVHGLTNSCGVAATTNAAFHNSSFVDNPAHGADWATPYQVDFLLNYTSTAQGGGDNIFDVGVSGQEAYTRLSGPKSLTFAYGHHCDAFKSGGAAWGKLAAAMGW